MIGQEVRQYQVQKKLGNGAMGSIYLALDSTLDRAVALKFILSDFTNYPDVARRFLEEAKVLAALNSPNIPVLYEYFIWNNTGVMAMEFVDGETFESMVLRRGPIPAQVTVPLIKQALRGLAAAHRRGVVHRDLKPGNLMLNKEETVKVVDFGIAKKIQSEARLTATNTTVGTPMYMAPEQIMGKAVDARTDLYSMGVVLYELLAGQVPFNADSIYEIQAAHIQKVPDPPTIHYPHIPQPVVEAVMKALQKAPGDRFASAEDFMRALPELEGLAIVATPPMPEIQPVPSTVLTPTPLPVPIAPAAAAPQLQPAPQLVNDSAPSPAWVSTPAAPVPAASVPAIAAPVAPAPTIAQPSKISVATQSSGGRNKALIAGVAAALVLVVGGAAWYIFKPAEPKPPAVVVNTNNETPTPLHHLDTSDNNNQPVVIETPATKPPARTEAKAKPRQPQTTTVAENTPPPPPARQPTPAASDLSGQWQGFYFDRASQQRTSVRLSMREVDGGRITGTLQFQTPDNTSGQCDLNGSSYQGGQLRLIMHCNPRVPYFNTFTTFSGVQPTANSLSGGTVFNAANMVASLQRY